MCKLLDFAFKTLTTFLYSKRIIQDMNDYYDIRKYNYLCEVGKDDKLYLLEFDTHKKVWNLISISNND